MTTGLIIFLSLLGGAVFLLSQVLIVPAFGSDAHTKRLLRRKLEEIDAVDSGREIASLLRQKYLRELSPLARRLEDSPHMESLGRAIEQAGLSILPHRLVVLAFLLAIVASLLIVSFTGNSALALLGFVAGGAAPFVYVSRKRRARLEKFEEQLPDAVDVMKRALRAGHPFSSCIKLVSEDMDEPIAREFEQAVLRRLERTHGARKRLEGAALFARARPIGGFPWLGFVAVGLVVVALALISPALVRGGAAAAPSRIPAI